MILFDAMPGWVENAASWWPTVLPLVLCACWAAAVLGTVVRWVRLLLRKTPDRMLPSGPIGIEKKAALRTLVWVAAAALGARLALYVWVWAAQSLTSGDWHAPWQSFASSWVHWDAPHYLKLAEQWYVSQETAQLLDSTQNDYLMLVFFPLFPLLLRGLRIVFGDALLSAVVLNALCTMGSACVLYGMVLRHYGVREARWAVVYLLVHPFSFFLASPHSEALFLLLTLVAIDAASRRRYGWAAVWGALSAYSRMLGVVVAAVIFVEGLRHWLEAREAGKPLGRLAAKVIACCALVGLGILAYLYLNLQITGSPWTFMEYQRSNWSQRFGNLWYTGQVTAEYMLRSFTDGYFLGTWLPQCVSMVGVLALLAVRQRRLPLAWAAYACAYVYAALAPTWLLSGARYLMVLAVWPVLQATLTTRRSFHIAFCALQGALLLLYTYLYTMGYYVM